MKKTLKYVGYTTALLVVGIIGILLLNYAPDKSLETLKVDWTYSNSQFITIDNLPVHYRINGTGTPLVLIHGTGASLHTWEKWTATLDDHFKVIALDMPAFGLTGPNSTGNYSLEYYAQFLDQFLTTIGVDSCHIGGNSLGGAIAWRYTAMYPEKVKKLILLDAGGYPPANKNDKPPFAFQLAKSPIWSKVLLTITPKSLFESSMKEVYHNDDLVTDQLINRYYELYLREGNRQAFIDRVNNLEYTDPSHIKTITAPTLIQWGKTDEWVPLANAYKFQKDIVGSKLIVYDNAGHLPMEEIPAQSVADAKAFLLDSE